MKGKLTAVFSIFLFSAFSQERLSDFPFDLVSNIYSIEKVDTLNGKAIVNVQYSERGGAAETWVTNGTTEQTFELKSNQKVTGLNARNARHFKNKIAWLYDGVYITNGEGINKLSEYDEKDFEIITSKESAFLVREHSNPRSLYKSFEIYSIDDQKNNLAFIEDSVRAYSTSKDRLYFIKSEDLRSFSLWEVKNGQKSLQNTYKFDEVPKAIDVFHVNKEIHLLMSFESSKLLLLKKDIESSFNTIKSFPEISGNPLQSFINNENGIPFFFINDPNGLNTFKLEESEWLLYTNNKTVGTINSFLGSFDRQISHDKLFALIHQYYVWGSKVPVIAELDIMTGEVTISKAIMENHLLFNMKSINNIEALGNRTYKINGPNHLQAIYNLGNQSYVDSLRFLDKTEIDNCFNLNTKKLCISHNLLRIDDVDSLSLLPSRLVATNQQSCQTHNTADGLIVAFCDWESNKYAIWKSDSNYENFSLIDSIPSVDINGNRSWLNFIVFDDESYFLSPNGNNSQRLFKLNQQKLTEISSFDISFIGTNQNSNKLRVLENYDNNTVHIEGGNGKLKLVNTEGFQNYYTTKSNHYVTKRRLGKYGRNIADLYEWTENGLIFQDSLLQEVNTFEDVISFTKFPDQISWDTSVKAIKDDGTSFILPLDEELRYSLNQGFAFARDPKVKQNNFIFDFHTQKKVNWENNLKSIFDIKRLREWVLFRQEDSLHIVSFDENEHYFKLPNTFIIQEINRGKELGFLALENTSSGIQNLIYFDLNRKQKYSIYEGLGNNSIKHDANSEFVVINLDNGKSLFWNYRSKSIISTEEALESISLKNNMLLYRDKTEENYNTNLSFFVNGNLTSGVRLEQNFKYLENKVVDMNRLNVRVSTKDSSITYTSPYPNEVKGHLQEVFEHRGDYYALLYTYVDGLQVWKLTDVDEVTTPSSEGQSNLAQVLPLSAENGSQSSKYDFTIFPNPSSDKIYFSEEVEDLKGIINMKGQVLDLKIISQENGLDISSLPKGIYVVLVKLTNGDFVTKRVIKK